MNLSININTDNDAFSDSNLGFELSRILTNYAENIKDLDDKDSIYDFNKFFSDNNGNKVGHAKASES